MQPYPRSVVLDGDTFTLRLMAPGDEDAILQFAHGLPEHDLLFLPRDISEPRVVKAWMSEIGRGIISLLAIHDGQIVGCATLVRDLLSWSKHVGELRIVTARAVRHRGLGRLLLQDIFAVAIAEGVDKIYAQMTTDQRAAIALFEDLGFRAEALLREHVRDRSGHAHDIVTMGNVVARALARLEAMGVVAATSHRA
ncbi:MAG: GNAT family N-acetyltransferase [Pseudomonadota bacterium]|jgi:L-amino acid N-acyltransferase YncA